MKKTKTEKEGTTPKFQTNDPLHEIIGNEFELKDSSISAVPPKGSFIFYRSFFDYIEETLSIKQRRLAYEVIMKYAFRGIIPDKKKIPKAVYGLYLLAKELIDAAERNRINGFLGKSFGIKGGKYGNRGGRPPKTDSNYSDDEPLPKRNNKIIKELTEE